MSLPSGPNAVRAVFSPTSQTRMWNAPASLSAKPLENLERQPEFRSAGRPNTDVEHLKRSEDGLPTSGAGQFSFGTMGILAPAPTAHYHGSSNRERGADKMIRLRVVEMSDWARSFVSEFLVLSPCAPALTALERALIMQSQTVA